MKTAENSLLPLSLSTYLLNRCPLCEWENQCAEYWNTDEKWQKYTKNYLWFSQTGSDDIFGRNTWNSYELILI